MSKFMGYGQSCTQKTRVKCTQSKINRFKCFHFKERIKITKPSIQFSNLWNQPKEGRMDYHTG